MPILTLNQANPFVDGRQSDRALTIQNGLTRHFEGNNWAVLPELTLSSGRRADILAISPKGQIAIIEIKSSINDFRTDTKWPKYRDDCDFLYFATLNDVPADIFPEDAGLYVADAYDAALLRDAPHHAISAARRKNVLLRFARTSAQRLTRCCDYAGLSANELAGDDEKA